MRGEKRESQLFFLKGSPWFFFHFWKFNRIFMKPSSKWGSDIVPTKIIASFITFFGIFYFFRLPTTIKRETKMKRGSNMIWKKTHTFFPFGKKYKKHVKTKK